MSGCVAQSSPHSCMATPDMLKEATGMQQADGRSRGLLRTGRQSPAAHAGQDKAMDAGYSMLTKGQLSAMYKK